MQTSCLVYHLHIDGDGVFDTLPIFATRVECCVQDCLICLRDEGIDDIYLLRRDRVLVGEVFDLAILVDNYFE